MMDTVYAVLDADRLDSVWTTREDAERRNQELLFAKGILSALGKQSGFASNVVAKKVRTRTW